MKASKLFCLNISTSGKVCQSQRQDEMVYSEGSPKNLKGVRALLVEIPGQTSELDLAQFLPNSTCNSAIVQNDSPHGSPYHGKLVAVGTSQCGKVLQGFLEAEFHHVMRQ